MALSWKFRKELFDGSIEIVLFYKIRIVKVGANVGIHKGLKDIKTRKRIGKILFGDSVIYHKMAK